MQSGSVVGPTGGQVVIDGAVVNAGEPQGERVVLDGTSKLRDGQKIRIVPAAAKPAP